MSDFHQMLRDRQYYLEVGPPPAEEEVLAAQQALGLGEAYDLEALQNTPESLPILGGDVPGQEDFTPKNTLGGLAESIDEGLMKGVEFANEAFIDEFNAAFQRFSPGQLEDLKAAGSIQPLNVTETDNPNIYIDNDTGEQVYLDGDNAIEVRGENGPEIFMRKGTDLNTGEEYDLTETNPLMNFGRYLNTGSLTDPIAVGGDALAPLIRMFQSMRGERFDETVLASGFITAAQNAANLRGKPVQAQGGIDFPSEKTENNLRLHLQRIGKSVDKGVDYPGGPKNPRTVIPAPPGSNLPDFVVGQIEPDDWRQRVETLFDANEIMDAASWYQRVFSEFSKYAGGNQQEAYKMARAWLSGQQNETPASTLNNVVFIYEQLKRGVPVDEIQGKGLPAANRVITDILTGAPVESGVGQKISDFIDSGEGKNVRSIMGNDPQGGSPFVVDVHTGRDTGLVDQELVNHLTRLGYDVPDNVVKDLAGGGIKGPQYENRAVFGHELTDYLNNLETPEGKGWMGRTDWEPSEIQAIGWMSLTKLYGGAATGGDVEGAFSRNIKRISMEVDPGAGSPFATKFGDDYQALDVADQYEINNQVTQRAIEMVTKRQGIAITNNVYGTGGWELYQNPATVQQTVASRETAVRAAAELGLLLNQTEVWVNRAKPLTKNPQHYGLDILESGTSNLRNSDEIRNLFNLIVESDPSGLVRGYQPIEDIAGKTGIRIIINKEAIKDYTKQQRKEGNKVKLADVQNIIQSFYNETMDDIASKLNYDISVSLSEIELDQLKNDWTKNPDGQGYKAYLGGDAGTANRAEDGSDLDSDRRELEDIFGTLINQAKAKRTNTEVSSPDDGGGL